MRTNSLAFGIFSILILASCAEKENDTRKWYKGNLHTHSYWSDGDEFPEVIMDWYKDHGYNFVALTDHNILAQGEKWIVVRKGKIYEEAFEEYLAEYGEEWVTFKRDTGRIQVRLKTYDVYKTLFEDESFLIMQGEEISDRFEGKPIHLNATNLRTLIKPQGGESVTDVMQRNVDALEKQRKETGVPMFIHLNHPNFHYAVTAEDIINLHGERFFEVFNGHPQVNNYGDSLHPGTEYMWDMINLAYYRKNQPMLMGLATDDSHNYHLFGSKYSNAGRGWVMVLADSLNPASIVEAMEAGDFYATTGVILDKVNVDLDALNVKVKAEEGVNYEIQFVGATGQDTHTHVLKRVNGTEGSIELLDSYIFVRAKIISDKLKENSFQEGDYETAWTQPIAGDPVR
jgi:hypothetical protein